MSITAETSNIDIFRFGPDYGPVDNPGPYTGRTVVIEPADERFHGRRLGLSQEEAAQYHQMRSELQRTALPRFIGEFVVDGLGVGGHDLQLLQIAALAAHSQALGCEGQPVGELAYGGYSGINFRSRGRLFGALNDGRARDVQAANQFYAVVPGHWQNLPGDDYNNPLLSMYGGLTRANRAPIVAAFALKELEAVGHSNRGAIKWQPRAGLNIEQTLRAVYYAV